MALKRPQPIAKKGFSLIAVAAILAIAAILIVTLLPNDTQKSKDQVKKTGDKILAIQKAVKIFQNQDANNALPCPALFNQDPGNASGTFGMSAGTASTPTTANCGACPTAGAIYCPNPTTYIGSVPTKTLGLPDDYAFDEWGNRLTYVMATPTADPNSTLSVTDLSGNTIPGIEALVISHGVDGVGAFNRTGASNSNCATTQTGEIATQSEVANCNFASANPNFIKDNWNSNTTYYFDDIVGAVNRCPANVADCGLWLDAYDSASITQTGGAVSVWKDKSGNGNDAKQPNSSNTPAYLNNAINYKSALQFNGSTSYLKTSNNFSFNDFTAIAMYRNTGNFGNNNHERLIDHSFTTGFWIGRNNGIANNWGGGVEYNSSPPPYNGPPYGIYSTSVTDGYPDMLVSKRNNTTHTIYGNGLATSPSTVSSVKTASNPMYFGASDILNNGDFTNSQIAEVAIYPRALSDTELLKLETYLSNKWNPCPAQVFGCNLWLDAADINNNKGAAQPGVGSVVSTWYDKSGNGNNAASPTGPTYDATAFNGHPTLDFNGTSQYLKVPLTETRPATIFTVYNSLSGNTGRSLSGDYSQNYNWLLGTWNGTGYGHYTGSFAGNAGYGSDTSANIILTGIDDVSLSSLYYNGTLQGSTTSTGNWGNNLMIGQLNAPGSNQGNPNEFGKDQMAEIIVYPRALTDAERKAVECYLAGKWGISVDCSTPGVINADLVNDYSGTQGLKGWRYGTIDSGNPASFSTAQVGYYNNYDWQGPPNQNDGTPYVASTFAHPAEAGGASAAYQYTASTSASNVSVTLSGVMLNNNSCDSSADGTIIRFYKNGSVITTYNLTNYSLDYNVPHTITANTSLSSGDTITLEIDKNTNTACDGTQWADFTIKSN